MFSCFFVTKLIINELNDFTCLSSHSFSKMPLICLPVNIRSYWIAKRFNTVYFDGLTCDNLIFDNKLVEQKNTRVKITFSGDKREVLLTGLHRENSDWKVNFDIDPTCGTVALDKDGNKLTAFKSENAYFDG